MSRDRLYREMSNIALSEYADICTTSRMDDESCRILFTDNSFLEIWVANDDEPMKRYSFHFERMHVDELIYRHDNAPHVRWNNVASYPKHFHNGSESNVENSLNPR